MKETQGPGARSEWEQSQAEGRELVVGAKAFLMVVADTPEGLTEVFVSRVSREQTVEVLEMIARAIGEKIRRVKQGG